MKKIAADTLFELKYLGNPTFSPDGRYLSYMEQIAKRESNRYRKTIHIYEISSGKDWALPQKEGAVFFGWTGEDRLLFGSEEPAAPVPGKKESAGADSKHKDPMAAVPQNQRACVTRVSTVTVAGELEKEECIPLRVRCILPAGAGREVLLADCRKEEEAGQPGIYEVLADLPFWKNGAGFVSGRRNRIFLREKGSGTLTAVTGEAFQVEGVQTDGIRILCWGYQDQPWKTEYGVYSYEIGTRQWEELVAPGEMQVRFADLWDGEAILAMTDGKLHGRNQYPDFYRYSFTEKKRSLLCPMDTMAGMAAVSTDSRLGSGRGRKAADGGYYFLATSRHNVTLRRLEKDGRISGPLTPEGACDGFDCRDGHVAASVMHGSRPAEIYLDGKQITRRNQGLLAEYRIQTPEPLCFKDPEGSDVFGWVLPPACPPEGPCPAILNIHGGPHDSFGALFHLEMQSLAAAGYYVFYCNPKGSSGYGSAFADLTGQYGTVDYETLMRFTDLVLEQYQEIDGSRLGVMGGSYGGFMVNWIITHTDRFRAAVSDRCISNWITHEHTSDIGPRYTKQEMGVLTAEDAGYLWELSPLRYANRVSTPTLFIHGDQDYRCFMGEGLSMFSALKRRGVETKLCLFHGENHDLSRNGRPFSRLCRMEEIRKWMDRHCR